MSTPNHEPGPHSNGHDLVRNLEHEPAPEPDRHDGVEPHALHGHDHDGTAGHDPHAGHDMSHAGHGDHVGQFRRLFWIMLVLAVPTVLLSPMFAVILGYELPDVPGITWVSPVLGTVIYVWGGRPFLSGAVGELKARKPGMMLLIGMAITVAFLASWGAQLGVLSTSSTSGGSSPCWS